MKKANKILAFALSLIILGAITTTVVRAEETSNTSTNTTVIDPPSD